MPLVRRFYDDLDTVIDEVHALFSAWEEDSRAPLNPWGREVLKLAIHEWIANLIQHADFAGLPPQIRLTVLDEQAPRLRCVIEDNSRGFDFQHQLVVQEFTLDAAPEPPERGRGLLMMIACTENISYRPVIDPGGDGIGPPAWQRLEFWISPQRETDFAPAEAAFDDGPLEALPHSAPTGRADA
jgi:serine/threonine-protein kinase RsbW